MLLAVLAVFRLSVLIALEDGPFDVLSLARERVGQTTWVGRGLHCPLCISFWLSLAAGFYLAQWGGSWALYWLGVAGAVNLVYRISSQ
jgi:hypothetical protein